YAPGDTRNLPPFPTRRSSDLHAGELVAVAEHEQRVAGYRERNRHAALAREHLQGVDDLTNDRGKLDRGLGPHVRVELDPRQRQQDRKSTRLNSSHVAISYAVF